MLKLDETSGCLFDQTTGRRFDPARRAWMPSPAPAAGIDVSPSAAAQWLQRRSGSPLRQPVAVIGPRETGPEQLRGAEALGTSLARLGFSIVCGGRQGVMEAVCRGAAAEGGISIGILPETDASQANAYVTVPIASGIGEARNVLVARAGFCIVAIGDSYGTLSEVALGLQFGRPVFGLCGAAQIQGVRHVASVDLAIDAVCGVALGLAP
jgi:uncharacterized protein (TIGR00725 family)